MVITVKVGPKEKAYWEERCQIFGWDPREAKVAICERVNANFFDMIQRAPNGVQFVEEDVDFDEEYAAEDLEFLRQQCAYREEKYGDKFD